MPHSWSQWLTFAWIFVVVFGVAGLAFAKPLIEYLKKVRREMKCPGGDGF
jgi:Na+-driven multidrug efflux pump